MKLSEMRMPKKLSNEKIKVDENNKNLEVWSDICKEIYENHYEVLETKCRNLFANNNYMDKEDIIHDVLCNAVVDFEQRVKRGADVNKKDSSKLETGFHVAKCIDHGVSLFIREDQTIKDKPHFCTELDKNGNGKSFLSQVMVLEEPVNPLRGEDKWRDVIEDLGLKEPIDKLIYEEYLDEFLNLIFEYQSGDRPKGFHRIENLEQIATLMIKGDKSREISRKVLNAESKISSIRKNILLPLALLVIDDELYYEKYLPLLSEKAKKIISRKKG